MGIGSKRPGLNRYDIQVGQSPEVPAVGGEHGKVIAQSRGPNQQVEIPDGGAGGFEAAPLPGKYPADLVV